MLVKRTYREVCQLFFGGDLMTRTVHLSIMSKEKNTSIEQQRSEWTYMIRSIANCSVTFNWMVNFCGSLPFSNSIWLRTTSSFKARFLEKSHMKNLVFFASAWCLPSVESTFADSTRFSVGIPRRILCEKSQRVIARCSSPDIEFVCPVVLRSHA